MRVLRGVLLAVVLGVAATPAEAGRRPAVVVAVAAGDDAKLVKLLKKAKKRDLDAFDDQTGSPTVGMRAIEVAAQRGNAKAVDALLAAGAEPTAKALEHAAAGGHLAIVQRLVEKGAKRADLALTAAAKAGHVEVVQALLAPAKQADPYFRLDQVLEFAVYFPAKPSAAVVELLLKEKASPAIGWGPGKQTALHLAVAKGAEDVVDVLVAGGAPLEAEDADGVTPLLSAVRGARFEVAKKLLAAGADPRKASKRGETTLSALVALDPADAATADLLRTLLAAKVPVDHAGKGGVTALMTAAGAGKRAWVDTLLARGASPAARDAGGRLAIDHALTCAVSAGTWAPPTVAGCHGEAALALLAGRAAPIGGEDRWQRTPLVRAIMTGHDPLVARVLERGGKSVSADQWGNTPWHYAARYGGADTVRALAAARLAGVDLPNDRDETPLALARDRGNPVVEQALLAAGARP